MSISSNNFSVSAGFAFFTQQTEKIVDKALGLAFTILDGTTMNLGRLLSDLNPTSVGDVLAKAKITGSVLLTTHPQEGVLRGDVLIEMSKDKEGRYLFQATDQSFKPVIYYQGKGPHALQVFEAKVTKYLSKIIKSAESVSYGNVHSRWKGELFKNLKTYCIVEGHLRQTDKGFLLHLPDEEPLIFDDSIKAESVLKYYYQDRKTPLEKDPSGIWDLSSRLLTGYLYFSGYLLAPWVQNNVRLQPEKGATDYGKVRYLSSEELAQMAKDEVIRHSLMEIAQGSSPLQYQLQNISFQSDGYKRVYEYEGHKVDESFTFSGCSENYTRRVSFPEGNTIEYITEKDRENLILTQKTIKDQKKVTFTRERTEWKVVNFPNSEQIVEKTANEIFKGFKRLTNSAGVYMATLIATQDPKMALIISLMEGLSLTFAAPIPLEGLTSIQAKIKGKRASSITLLNPQPNVWVTPGNQFSGTINLKTDYVYSGSNQNLYPTLQTLNGVPNGFCGFLTSSITMAPLTPISSLFLDSMGVDSVLHIEVIDQLAFVAGSTSLYVVDFSGQIPFLIEFAGFFSSGHINAGPSSLYVGGDTLYFLHSTSSNPVMDIYNISSLRLSYLKTIKLPSADLTGITVTNNIMHVLMNNSVVSFNLNNPMSITNTTVPFNIGYPVYGITTINGYYCVYSVAKLIVFSDISNPKNTLVTTLNCPTNLNANNIVTAAVGNQVFTCVGSENYLFIFPKGGGPYEPYDSQSPLYTVFLGMQASVSNLLLTQDFIYASCQDGGVVVVSVINYQIVATFTTTGSVMDAVLIGNNLCIADGAAGFTYVAAHIRNLNVNTGNREGQCNFDIIVKDDAGATAVNPWTVNVGVQSFPPTNDFAMQSAVAEVGAYFYMPVPSNTFSGSNLTLTAKQLGGTALPNWLQFKTSNTTSFFEGIPSAFDVNAFSATVLEIEIYATNSAGSAKTDFKITVQGQSFWSKFLSGVGAFGSAVGLVYGTWKERSKIWNYFYEKEYLEGAERAIVGKPFSRPLNLPYDKISKIQIFNSAGDPLLPNTYPDGLFYKSREIQGTPTAENIGYFTVCVFDTNGYIDEKFPLLIKNETDADPTPDKKLTYVEATNLKITEIRDRFFLRDDCRNCYSKKKSEGSTSIRMRLLSKSEVT